MKKSKRKRKQIEKQEEERKLRKQKEKAERLSFWEGMQNYTEKDGTIQQDDDGFEEILDDFAGVYGVKKLFASLREHPELPKLTKDIFKEWLSISDYELRKQVIDDWITSAKIQKEELEHRLEAEFKKRHPYRFLAVMPSFPSGLIFDYPLLAEVIDVTSGDVIRYSTLKEYNIKYHPEIKIEEEVEWLRNSGSGVLRITQFERSSKGALLQLVSKSTKYKQKSGGVSAEGVQISGK